MSEEITIKADGGHLVTFTLSSWVDLSAIERVTVYHPGKGNGRWYQNDRALIHEEES